MRKFSMHRWWLLTVLLTVPALGIAAVPNLFTAGTLISASQVNSNFNNLDARLAALEMATPRFNVIGMAKVTGTTVRYFGGNGTTSVTSAVQSDGSLDIRFLGNFAGVDPNRLLVFASADNNSNEFNVANGRMLGFGATGIFIQAGVFRSNTAITAANGTINVMVVAVP
jgi:hypothetical protein